MSKRVVAIIQARSGSKRLPKKVLLPLGNQPVIWHVITAVRSARLIDEVILATTESPLDDDVAEIGHRMGVRVHRGEEADVLSRFVHALEHDNADVVVRHVGDAPLVDPGVIDTVIGSFLKGDCDYATNFIERSWPRGTESEVMSRTVLEVAHREGIHQEDREHVTVYLRNHPEKFSLHNVTALPQDTWPELRLTLDTLDDYAVLQSVFDALYVPGCITRIGSVIGWLRQHPEVVARNVHVPQKPVLGRVW